MNSRRLVALSTAAALRGLMPRHRLLLSAAIAASLALLPAAHGGVSDTIVTTSPGNSTLELSEGSTLVDALVTATVPVDLANATVQVSDGWQPEDVLSCDEPAAGLSCTYEVGTGVLSVTGTASSAEWEATLRSVRLATASTSEESRVILFAVGAAIPFQGDDHTVDHYYEYVSACDGAEGACGVSWPEAKVLASQAQLFGLQGYLATITDASENALIAQKLVGDGWIGASDDYREINAVTAAGHADQSSAEGSWYWVTGPEAGTLISTGNYVEGAAPVAAAYMNWAEGEPNNYDWPDEVLPNGEYYGQIYSSGGGTWNDLPGSPIPLGYVVEYGDTPGDPVVQLSASKTVTVNPVATASEERMGLSAFDPLLLMFFALAAARKRR